MEVKTKIVSKVLIHEFDDDALSTIKTACLENNLIGLKVSTEKATVGLKDVCADIHDILSSNIDLGAIFISEDEDTNGYSGIELSQRVHKVRPELPIFLRTKDQLDWNDLAEDAKEVIVGCYQTGDLEHLNSLINHYICSMYYPIELAKGIQEISFNVFKGLIPDVEIKCDYPYLVNDQIIYGEIFSLIPLESKWCRGYMMLQTSENELREVIRSKATAIHSKRPNITELHAILNEATNMVWGGLKARFLYEQDSEASSIHVPIIVNHSNKNISFGSTRPQLCFKYTLHDAKRRFNHIVIYQRIIFNLNWSPENFSEIDHCMEQLIDTGELELF